MNFLNAESFLIWLTRASVETSLVAGLVLLAQHLLRNRVSARWRYNLWLLVILRLALPVFPASKFSPFNLIYARLSATAYKLPHADNTLRPPISVGSAPRTISPPAPGADRIASVSPAQSVNPSQDFKPLAIAEHKVADSTDVPNESGSFSGETLEAVPSEVDLSKATLDTDPTNDVAADALAAFLEESAKARQYSWTAPRDSHSPVREMVRGADPTSGTIDESATSDTKGIERKTIAKVETATVSATQLPVTPMSFHRRANWAVIVFLAWFTIAILLSSRAILLTLRLSIRLRNLAPVESEDVKHLLATCCDEAGVRRVPRMLSAPPDLGPALVGMIRPTLLLPESVIASLDQNELRLVILHELVHLKRRDIAMNWLLSILSAMHWFNPVIWWAIARLRADRELACDEAVLSLHSDGQADADRRDYGTAIIKLLETVAGGVSPPAVVGVLDGSGKMRTALMRRRVTMIAHFSRPKSRWSLAGVAVSLAIGAVALTGSVRGQQEKPAEPPGQNAGTAAPTAAPGDGQSAPGNPALPEGGSTSGGSATPSAPPTPGEGAGAGNAVPTPTKPGTVGGGFGSGGFGGAGVPPQSGRRGNQGGGFGGGGAGGAGGPGLPAGQRGGFGGGGGGFGRGATGGTGNDWGGPANPGANGHPGGGTFGTARGALRPEGMPGQPDLFPSGPAGMSHVEDPDAARADARTLEHLHKPLTADFAGVPLHDVISYMSDQTGVDAFLDSKSLETFGLATDAPVNIHLRQPLPADQVLRLALRSAGGDQIGYAIEHGVVYITSRHELELSQVTRGYDISDFKDREDDLTNAILRTISPQTWDTNGGSGSVIVLGNKMIVTTAEPRQREIAKLLALVREKSPEIRAAVDPSAPAGDARKRLHILQEERDELQSQLDVYKSRYAESHPQVRALTRQLQQLTNRIEQLRLEIFPADEKIQFGSQSIDVPHDMADEIRKLWEKDYTPRLILIAGKAVNEKEVQSAFAEEVQKKIAAFRSNSGTDAHAPAAKAKRAFNEYAEVFVSGSKTVGVPTELFDELTKLWQSDYKPKIVMSDEHAVNDKEVVAEFQAAVDKRIFELTGKENPMHRSGR